jgi:carbonic anhydrase
MAAAGRASRRQGRRARWATRCHGHAAHWAYRGEAGPQAWGGLKPEFQPVRTGKRQSPIDIRGGIAVDLEPVQFDYRGSGFRVIDNGHTVQVNLGRAMPSRWGRRYDWCSSTSTARRKSASTAASSTCPCTWCTRTPKAGWPWWPCCWTAAAPQPLVQTVWNNLPLEKGEESARVA